MPSEHKKKALKRMRHKPFAPATMRVTDVLRAGKATQIMQVTPENDPVLHNMVADQCPRFGLGMPEVYVYDDKRHSFQAAVHGTQPPAITVSLAMRKGLNPEELKAVIGHELAHATTFTPDQMKRDRMKRNVKIGFAGAASYGLLHTMHRRGASVPAFDGALVGTAAATAIAPMAVDGMASRARERQADKDSVQIGGNRPVALASALDKTHDYMQSQGVRRMVPKSLKQLGQKILRPITRTHPTFEKRIRELGVTRDDIAAYQAESVQPMQQQQGFTEEQTTQDQPEKLHFVEEQRADAGTPKRDAGSSPGWTDRVKADPSSERYL